MICVASSSSLSQPSEPLKTDGLHNSWHALRSWATLIHCLLPNSSMLSFHFLLSLPLTRSPSLGVHSDIILAHLVLLVLATCPAHCPLMHCTPSIISCTPVLDLINSFRTSCLFVMCNNDLSMPGWATTSFFYWCKHDTDLRIYLRPFRWWSRKNLMKAFKMLRRILKINIVIRDWNSKVGNQQEYQWRKFSL